MPEIGGEAMEENIKVSIIVPIYNGEDHLAQTLDCMVGQSFEDMEILCVSDGSTDRSVDIIKEYQEKDSRIVLLEKEKSNAGAARNYALDRAKGKYLLFWDGDDLFEPEAVELMYNKIEEDKADICVCNANHYDSQKEIFISKPQYLNKSRLPEQIPFSKETNGKYIFNFSSQVAWNKMYLREFIQKNNIRFQEIPRINDHYFVSVSMVLAECITIVDKVLVHYRVNQTENLTGTSSDTPLCKYEVQKDIKKKLQELKLFDNEEIKQSFVNKALNTTIHGLNIQNDIEGYKVLYCKMKEEGLDFLELFDYGEDYYYNSLEYHNLKLMREFDYDAYLFNKTIDYRQNIENKNTIISQHKKKVKKLEDKIYEIENRKSYIIMKKILRIYYKITGR